MAPFLAGWEVHTAISPDLKPPQLATQLTGVEWTSYFCLGNVLLDIQNCSLHLKMLASEYSAFILGFYCLVSTSSRAQNLHQQLLKLLHFWAEALQGLHLRTIHSEDLLASSEVFKLSYLQDPPQ